jgi:hypothetical protein
MFNKRMTNMEKLLDTSSKLLPFLKNKFEELQYFVTMVMTDWMSIKFSLHAWEKSSFSWMGGKRIGSLK